MKLIRMPLTVSVPLLLFGLLLIFAAMIKITKEYMEVVAFQGGPAPLIVFLGFVSFGLVMVQVGVRNISRKPFDPTRHIFSDWVLYPVGVVWALVGFLNLIYGFLSGAPILGVGALMLSYTFKRPKKRDPTPFFRLQMPISKLNGWSQLFIGNKAPYVFVGASLAAWIFPWEFISATRWHQNLVELMMPFMPGLQALHDRGANPEFSVGLMSAVSILIFITMMVDVRKSQVADRVVSGEYPVREALKSFAVLSIWIAIAVWLYPKIGAGDSYLANLKRENKLYLVIQQMSFVSTINISFILALSFFRGLFLIWRRSSGCTHG